MPMLSVDPAKLLAARLRAGFTREEVAVAIGAAYGSIAAYEAGKIVPHSPKLLALADLYSVAVEELCSARPGQVASSAGGCPKLTGR